MENRHFSKSSTNACKGVALVLLLWHHLFYMYPDFGYITHKIALLSKVCVAIFVILSGYGLSESVKFKNIGLFEFYKNRLVVLYTNYWFMALIFVSIGILFMGRTLQDAFTGQIYAKFIIQMIGFHRYAYTEFGYNATWWYMSVIISLVLLFPFIYDLTKKYGIVVLLFCFVILLPKWDMLPVINAWLLPFVLGIFFSQRNYIVFTSEYFAKYGNWRFIILLSVIVIVAFLRSRMFLLRDIEIDWLFGSIIILFCFEVTSAFSFLEKILAFLGKHLFNIFLFHTFIYLYYWNTFIYSVKNPILIFLLLLIVCLTVSMMLEQIKRRLYFVALVEKITSSHIPSNIEIIFQQNTPGDACTSRH